MEVLMETLEQWDDGSWTGTGLRFGVAAAAGGLMVLALMLLWRQVAWWREPAWIKNAPMVPEPNLMSMVAGCVLEFVQQGAICRTFMHDDQPDILRLNNGLAGGLFRDFIFVKDPKIAREILEEPNTCKPERGYRAFRRLTGYKGNYDFLSSHSHNDALYARTRVPAYETLMKRTVTYYDTLFLSTVRRVVKRCGETPDGRFKVVDEMHQVATSLITSVAFDEQSEKFDKNLFDCAVWIIGDMIERPQNNSMKFLDDLPTPRNRELKRRQGILVDTIEAMIANKKAKPGDDVISKLLEDKQNTDNDLLGVLSIFFFAGFDTTSNTMSMVLYHLANNPDVQERARRDVIDVMGRHKEPKLHKLFHMQYLLAVIKETLRMFPTVPMVTREVTERHEDGVCPRFKEESTFGTVINFFGLHYNKKGWNRPNEFVPERWIDPSVDADRDPDQRLYCPFAIGKRACLGRQFAYIEMLTVISMILQNYRILPSDKTNEVKIHEGGTLVVDHGLELALEPYEPGKEFPIKSVRVNQEEPEYTLDEVGRHHTLDDLWMIIDGGVYDLTRYAKLDKGARHPGGVEILVAYAGSDGTSEFDFINHSKFARRLLSRYRIGKVAETEHSGLLNKEDKTKHVLGPEIARGRRRRTTVPVMAEGYGDQPPMRNFKA
ncbi:Cytochrome P450 3A21 (CYPIIIA21) (Cytochrome P450 CM3A-10) [Durusdinium trenchii]|uniref:Cytochrome P450 3A21 (CYPIIIA21) (Cytochrome P450 CM3A-10) n=1 Tax=Durusdinium trenchii TaxID=1381693 RepID=A0ABP0HKZ2_9DINO